MRKIRRFDLILINLSSGFWKNKICNIVNGMQFECSHKRYKKTMILTAHRPPAITKNVYNIIKGLLILLIIALVLSI